MVVVIGVIDYITFQQDVQYFTLIVLIIKYNKLINNNSNYLVKSGATNHQQENHVQVYYIIISTLSLMIHLDTYALNPILVILNVRIYYYYYMQAHPTVGHLPLDNMTPDDDSQNHIMITDLRVIIIEAIADLLV